MKFEFKDIPKICINLKRNHVRRYLVSKEFRTKGIGPVKFFNAIDRRNLIVPELSPKAEINEGYADGVLACAMSHIAVIRIAKENGWPAVCVFEDDVEFCETVLDKIKYLESLDNFDFDILCLGGHFVKEYQPEDAEGTEWKNVLRVKRMSGTYALIFSANTFDFILRNWNYHYGADEFYSNHVYNRFKTYAYVPFLAGCMPNRSDITGREGAYESIDWYYDRASGVAELPRQIIKEIPKPFMKDCTFIIPVRIDSEDRKFNFLHVLQYLCKTITTNIFIFESDKVSVVADLLKQINCYDCHIKLIFEQTSDDIFHRTRFLNVMLSQVSTPVTVNYDIDVMLPRDSYEIARDRITQDGYDLIYPYFLGESQYQITIPDKQSYNGEDLFDPRYLKLYSSLAGHVQFFKTDSYRAGFMENENFISYGAEDAERLNRFKVLGYNVDHCDGMFVYHIEHARGINSSGANPHFDANATLYYHLKNMDRDKLIEYYSRQAYLTFHR